MSQDVWLKSKLNVLDVLDVLENTYYSRSKRTYSNLIKYDNDMIKKKMLRDQISRIQTDFYQYDKRQTDSFFQYIFKVERTI